MVKRLLVAVAIAAPLVLMTVAEQARLGAQSGTSVVINEFRARGPNGGNDEFIELFNPTSGSVDISGWKVRGSNVSGTIGDRLTLPPNTTLGPGCYYLATNAAASGYSGTVTGNQTYTTGITDDGGLALTLANNSIVDQVGLSAGSAFGEVPGSRALAARPLPIWIADTAASSPASIPTTTMPTSICSRRVIRRTERQSPVAPRRRSIKATRSSVRCTGVVATATRSSPTTSLRSSIPVPIR